MSLYAFYDMLNMFWALLCPSSGAVDYMCVFATYVCRARLLFVRGQVQDSRVCILDAHPAALQPDPDKQQPSTANTHT